MNEEKHIDDILSRGGHLCVEEEERMCGRAGSPIGREIRGRCDNITARWTALKSAVASTSASLEASRYLLRYQSEVKLEDLVA